MTQMNHSSVVAPPAVAFVTVSISDLFQGRM